MSDGVIHIAVAGRRLAYCGVRATKKTRFGEMGGPFDNCPACAAVLAKHGPFYDPGAAAHPEGK